MGMNNSLTELGQEMLSSTGSQTIQTLAMQNGITQEKIVSDLSIMDKELSRYGAVALDQSRPVTMTITNQVTKKSENATFPALKAGGQMLTQDFTLVDAVQSTVGGTATIFQVLPGKLLRVSTNVRKLDGKRATGTYIPDSSPVYKAVMSGETFRGKAFVVNDWFITAYKPLRDASGAIVAVIYVGRKILTPQLQEFLAGVNLAGKGYAAVFNDKGQILAHPNKDLLGSDVRQLPVGALLADSPEGVVGYDFKGKKRHAALFDFTPWGWRLVMTVTRDELLHGTDSKLVRYGLISAAVALVLSVLLVMGFTRISLAPIKAAAAVAERAAEGDLDARMDVRTRDDIGRLFATFNSLMERIKASMRENQGYVNMLNAVSDPIYAMDPNARITLANEATYALSRVPREQVLGNRCSLVLGAADGSFRQARAGASGEERTVTADTAKGTLHLELNTSDLLDDAGNCVGQVEIARDVSEMVRKEQELQENLKRINEVNVQVREAGETLAGHLQDVAGQISQIQSGTDVQRQRTTETATAMEQMNATVLEVARSASQAAQHAEEARSKADEGVREVGEVVSSIHGVQEQILELKERMGELGEQAQGIGQIMTMITDIADQTNLLALNAAIEAARAGDAGRGFAVVADEVRKLAEKTMTATQEVGASVRTIQDGTRQAIRATEKTAEDVMATTGTASASGERLEEIRALVESTSEQVRSIATAAEEQSSASEEINQSVDEINRIAGETADGMARTAQAMEELNELSIRLKDLAGHS
ncbi:methyl-accepting chemotaxis protein [Desulfocurvus sp. DL9XJH121]